MNNYRKIAEFVRSNKITVKKNEVKGKCGGFDDRVTLKFFKGLYIIKSIEIKAFDKKPIDPANLLKELQIELDKLQTIGVFDEETMIDYLITNHGVNDGNSYDH